MTPAIVVDTNVLAISEGLNGNASEACVAACTRLARRIQEGRAVVVVDDGDEILTEYLRILTGRGTSGIGVKLARILRQRKYDTSVCRRVKITSSSRTPGTYDEVPDLIRNFDNDDQKFLAVAMADPEHPQIYAGLDEEWWCRRSELMNAGFDVQFPCSDDLMDTEC